MARGAFRPQPIKKEEQYAFIDDMKLQMSLAAIADKYNEHIRTLIYRTYQDDHLASIYRGIRNSGIYDKGGASRVHRKIVEFPNAHVFDFCDTVLSALYGPDWLYEEKALKHELVRPWHVVSKL